ncbi:peptidylprolyl isomerase [Thalassospira sp. TSL5-1]|uniref:peptidylprolyl isomerase n=1 Tax=Thalassospira sp. TSL5-1 TaxID=1544451 RepID=UPI000A8C593B|nr:peptidylprolyl isomerase [Thalassospira sp. TSL5-1]
MRPYISKPLQLCAMLLGVVLLTFSGGQARAQSTIGLAAVVNDQPISVVDLIDRLKLVATTSNIQLTDERRREMIPQILHQLIDETLQMQEAKRLGYTVSDEDMNRAIAAVEQNSGMPPGGLERYLQLNNIPLESLKEQLRPQIAWQKVLRSMRRDIEISESEIDDVLERIKRNQDKPRNNVQEIFLPIDNPQEESKILDNAQKIIGALRNGASFEGLARQFSANASAANGGNLGWMSVGEMDSTLEDAINKMEPGQISQPIRTVRGYYILKLLDRAKGDTDADRDVKLDLYQLYVPISQNASNDEIRTKVGILQNARDTAKSCEDMAKIAVDLGSDLSGRTKGISPQELSGTVAAAVSQLKDGETSNVIRVDGGALVVMLCGSTVKSTLPDRDTIHNRLLMERLEIAARRKLRELRREAFIDIRI